VDVCTVIDRAMEVCSRDIEAKGLRVRIDAGDPPYVVNADAARLQQVFWNLLKNAIKFTPTGGTIDVGCRGEPDAVVVEVRDSGIGIEPEELGTIFDAFAQSERVIGRRFGGLGLGLTLSKDLVELHGGTIEARSEGADRGASFRVRLPLLRSGAEAQVPASPAPEPPRAVPTRPVRVLLVEDHHDTAEMMSAMLQLEGHEVVTAGDVATGLRLLGGPPFDLLISDLGLPDRSGLDLMAELRGRGDHTPAIALSGYGQESDVEQSLAAGFALHLTKPVEPDRLFEAIARVAALPGSVAATAGARGVDR
jgi:two-component system CheB/CheR fusion protein